MKTIWCVSDSSEEPYTRSLLSMVRESSLVQGFRCDSVRIDDERYDIKKRLKEGLLAFPDAVLCRNCLARRHIFEDLGVPFFDVDWLLRPAKPQESAIGEDFFGFGIGIDGSFTGSSPGWTCGWKNASQAWKWLEDHSPSGLIKGPEGPEGAPPKGHMSGRVSSGSDQNDTSAAIAVFCFAVGHVVGAGTGAATEGAGYVAGKAAAEAMCHVVVEAAVEGAKAAAAWVSNVENLPTSKPAGGVPNPDGGPPPSQQNRREPDEESGRDFVLLMREWFAKTIAERDWQFWSGAPEESDVREEFRSWLKQNGILVPPTEGLRSEEDETGYSFLYFLYREARGLAAARRPWLEYWWHRGGPIDPISYAKGAVVRQIAKHKCVTTGVNRDGTVGLRLYL